MQRGYSPPPSSAIFGDRAQKRIMDFYFSVIADEPQFRMISQETLAEVSQRAKSSLD